MRKLKEWLEPRGRQKRLADHCNVTHQAVMDWVRRGVVPRARVVAVAELTRIPRAELNPEAYDYRGHAK